MFKILTATLFILNACFIISCSSAQYEVIEDDGDKIVVGKLNWEEWQKVAGWEDYTSTEYEPDRRKAIDISDYINVEPLEIIIFSASWCHDSSEVEIPKLYKLLTKAGIFPDKITLYGLDRDKREPTGIAEKYDIEKVPTLVVLAVGEEVDRIVEHPEKSWEDDLIKIIRKDMFDVQQSEDEFPPAEEETIDD